MIKAYICTIMYFKQISVGYTTRGSESLLKRGVYGTFHHVGEGFLPQYLVEFEYRSNQRKMSDEARFAVLMAQTQGRLLLYCRRPQQQNPHA